MPLMQLLKLCVGSMGLQNEVDLRRHTHACTHGRLVQNIMYMGSTRYAGRSTTPHVQIVDQLALVTVRVGHDCKESFF